MCIFQRYKSLWNLPSNSIEDWYNTLSNLFANVYHVKRTLSKCMRGVLNILKNFSRNKWKHALMQNEFI